MLSPEARLVFRTADPACEPSEIAAIARAVTDWPRVFAIAEREAATSNLWRELRRAEAVLPEVAADAFRRAAMVRDLGLQRLAQRAQHTSQLLAERGIPFLLLKGAAVGAMFDPTFRARPMGDVDLLVHREDTARAQQAVIDSGWPLTTDPNLLELLKDAHHLPHFVDPQMPGSRLELHVKLMPDDQPFAVDEGDLWRDARPAPAPFAGASVPSPEHMMLHAAVHFAWQHTMTFGAWRTIRLISLVANQPGFDWDGFVKEALARRAGTSCYWTLRLAETLSGVTVPLGVLARFAPPTPEFVLAAIERHFIATIAVGERPQSPSVKVTRWLWVAAIRPGWSGHANPGRSDPENKWAKAYGVASTETLAARIVRHFKSLRAWWEFALRTLLA